MSCAYAWLAGSFQLLEMSSRFSLIATYFYSSLAATINRTGEGTLLVSRGTERLSR